MNTTVTDRVVGPDKAASHSRIGQRMLMFLMEFLGGYLAMTIL